MQFTSCVCDPSSSSSKVLSAASEPSERKTRAQSRSPELASGGAAPPLRAQPVRMAVETSTALILQRSVNRVPCANASALTSESVCETLHELSMSSCSLVASSSGVATSDDSHWSAPAQAAIVKAPPPARASAPSTRSNRPGATSADIPSWLLSAHSRSGSAISMGALVGCVSTCRTVASTSGCSLPPPGTISIASIRTSIVNGASAPLPELAPARSLSSP
mmetsp:Transcript_838/g.2173  ORF Transcript_838/g.2173 Transcript_838/m.2173 type:complete len:221 (+) Transcript_838:84-746(+)